MYGMPRQPGGVILFPEIMIFLHTPYVVFILRHQTPCYFLFLMYNNNYRNGLGASFAQGTYDMPGQNFEQQHQGQLDLSQEMPQPAAGEWPSGDPDRQPQNVGEYQLPIPTQEQAPEHDTLASHHDLIPEEEKKTATVSKRAALLIGGGAAALAAAGAIGATIFLGNSKAKEAPKAPEFSTEPVPSLVVPGPAPETAASTEKKAEVEPFKDASVFSNGEKTTPEDAAKKLMAELPKTGESEAGDFAYFDTMIKKVIPGIVNINEMSQADFDASQKFKDESGTRTGNVPNNTDASKAMLETLTADNLENLTPDLAKFVKTASRDLAIYSGDSGKPYHIVLDFNKDDLSRSTAPGVNGGMYTSVKSTAVRLTVVGLDGKVVDKSELAFSQYLREERFEMSVQFQQKNGETEIETFSITPVA